MKENTKLSLFCAALIAESVAIFLAIWHLTAWPLPVDIDAAKTAWATNTNQTQFQWHSTNGQ
jgi:hypothetical protein